MSTTSIPTSRPAAVSPPDAADAFDVIWNDDTTCNGCFARIRERTEFQPAGGVSEYAPTESVHRAHDGVGGRHPDTLPTEHAKTYCGQCGSEHGRALDDTLSRREALARCGELADRVEALGLDVDRETLRLAVRKGKSRDSLQGHDTEIFRLAVRLAATVDS